MRKIDAAPLVQFKLIDHLLDTFELHFQAQPVKIAVAGFHDGNVNVRLAMIATHTAGELIANSDAAAAHEVRLGECDLALLQSRSSHQGLPGRSWWKATLDGAI